MKSTAALTAAIVAVIVLLCTSAAITDDGPASASCTGTGRGTVTPRPVPTGAWHPVGAWDSVQVAHAAVIVAVGQQAGVPARGWVVAVATAMVESRLLNLDYGDRDSVGLFQQRPSQGWGTPAQLQDPVYASRRFYTALAKVDGWETMPLTVAAQTVQKSAFPDRYGEREHDAEQVVAAVTGAAAITDLPGASLAICAGPPAGTGGWVRPVDAVVGSGFGRRGGEFHAGVDLSAARHTVIRAASAGTVAASACNSTRGTCDVDGSRSIIGCGWYVDIAHTGGIGTRYCHMVRRPEVTVGDTVTAGQPIGLVGSSGNSSGPHLHFEVHEHACGNGECQLTPVNAVDPVVYLRVQGAPLGVNS
ncbi:murein DD-endopeptidase MepM/ murein hydrolase activator NlpD [Catenuloplanes nepalensis]|uniref:Murein DD-endopeptidase MepM/ murein hydrolase activator NlpD n=1 Tax=Catenuloplanes nepalensis TaxID=587533 RepID=A0ABT9MMC1_9ACTN|nr:M23 family metallopeptidase [Catenuloplanes nepalensis]MDP9792575.1 murein DD-endopeptidase MepM/ murein hydrolase activator NlpD [Catenuloplanes nepalensis]